MRRMRLPILLAWASALASASGALPAGLVDAGDRLMTPAGQRTLYRVADQVAVHTRPDADIPSVVAGLTARGGALEGYTQDRAGGREFRILIAPAGRKEAILADPSAIEPVLNAARADRRVLMCNPVFADPDSGLRAVVGQDIVIRLQPGEDADEFFAGSSVPFRRLPHTQDQWILTLSATRVGEILAEANRLAADPRVIWTQPDFASELVRDYTPNDPHFSDAWHLHNTGAIMYGTRDDADVDAPQAWDITRGTNTIVIAVLDDGVQWDHPDLAANIFSNAGEVINGIDDDGNGYIDDIRGWDFYHGNNDPAPSSPYDNHGTPVAGVAAAVGDNNLGVVGIAYQCRIMPIKVSWELNFIFESVMASAIRYAAGIGLDGTPGAWRGADVFNMSHGYGYGGALYDAALDDATALGRGGKGCVLFASTGNLASGFRAYSNFTGFAGTDVFLDFIYRKDASGTGGEDTVWLANIVLPNSQQTRIRFDEASLPEGWTAGGHAAFAVVDDHEHAYGTGRYVARSGAIGHSQVSWLRSPVFEWRVGRPLQLHAWVDTQKGATNPVSGDWFQVLVTRTDTGAVVTNWVDSGVPGDRVYQKGHTVNSAIRRPASHSNVVAVGGSTDLDYRYNGSNFGPELDFVAPTKGGIRGIWTTDRTDTDGYVWLSSPAGDYYDDFGGTSSSCPLAAGIGALLLSAEPDLTWQQVRDRMRASCEKVGGLAYDANGWNPYYGYGRVNAWGALAEIPYNLLLTNLVITDTREYLAYNTITARNVQVKSPGEVTLRAGARVDIQPASSATNGAVLHAIIEPEL